MFDRDGKAPAGAVPLSAAIAALRDELTQAWWDGQHRSVRFKPSPVELTLQVAVTREGKGTGGNGLALRSDVVSLLFCGA